MKNLTIKLFFKTLFVAPLAAAPLPFILVFIFSLFFGQSADKGAENFFSAIDSLYHILYVYPLLAIIFSYPTAWLICALFGFWSVSLIQKLPPNAQQIAMIFGGFLLGIVSIKLIQILPFYELWSFAAPDTTMLSLEAIRNINDMTWNHFYLLMFYGSEGAIVSYAAYRLLSTKPEKKIMEKTNA